MARSLCVAVALCCATACTKREPITAPFVDTFERAELGSDYESTGGPYRIVDGKLTVRAAYNKPLWLRRQLPRDATIELDVSSKTPDGDIKLEAWGDGASYATHKGAYLASSYVFIFGGWNNAISVLARLDEHGNDRKQRRGPKVQRNRTYRWKIVRRGGRVRWFVDGELFLEMDDSAPLEGARHAHLGFNNWQSDVTFDNLRITPLK